MSPLAGEGNLCANLVWPDLVSPYITSEVGGVLHCTAVRIIVEIHEHIQSIGQVLVNLGGLGCEGPACIAATIANPVKAQIGPVSGKAPRMVGDEVMDGVLPASQLDIPSGIRYTSSSS